MKFGERPITTATYQLAKLGRRIELVLRRTRPMKNESDRNQIALNERDRNALNRLVQMEQGKNSSVAGRTPTDEEVVLAAWGNLRIEEPDVTIQDARRAILGTP